MMLDPTINTVLDINILGFNKRQKSWVGVDFKKTMLCAESY